MSLSPVDDALTDHVQVSLIGVAARDLKRLHSVFKIIARHGFGELFLRSAIGKMFFSQVPVEGDSSSTAPAALRFRKLLEELGPTYIKFGQIMSMRPDIMPASYITALEGLQDQARPIPFNEIKQVVEKGLGRSLTEAFRSFDERPLATASIGQTHRAVTLDGAEVVVKVQRPGIEHIMRGDLSLLYMLAKAFELGIEEMRLIAPADFVVEFERALLSELDFTEELHNLSRARSLLDPQQNVTVPKPYPELSARTVLTMDFFKGKAIRQIVPHSEEAKLAVSEIVRSTLKQIFVDGFFHGDPHSGNILINSEGKICFIDYGQVGTLRPDQKADLIAIVIAVLTKDVTTISRVFLRMGTPLKRVDLLELRSVITRVMDEYGNIGSFRDLKSRELADEFINAAQRFQIKLASEYTLLIKATLTVEGIVRSLYPEVDVMTLAKPLVRDLMGSRLSPTGFVKDALSQLMALPDLLKQLPSQLDQILHDSQTGNLQLRALTPQLDLLPQTVHHLGSRLALVAFAVCMTMTAVIFLAIGQGTSLQNWLIGLSALAAASSWSTLFFWHFVQSGRPFRVSSVLQFLRR